jgi:LacI family transcriptional regulator
MSNGLTLREIARLAKVSTATVSRAINRVPTVNPVLARRIRKVIEKEGYFPNTNARALVRGRSRSLGLIVSEITNPFFPEIVQTFAKLGAQHNHEILLSSIDHDPRLLERAARQMIERRVGGVAILTFGDELPLIDALTARNVPVFVVDADAFGPLLKTVQIDYEHGIRQAVQHLAALGHERMGWCIRTAKCSLPLSDTPLGRREARAKGGEELDGMEQAPPRLKQNGTFILGARASSRS